MFLIQFSFQGAFSSLSLVFIVWQHLIFIIFIFGLFIFNVWRAYFIGKMNVLALELQ